MSYRVLHLIGGGEIGGAEQHILTLFNNFKQDRVTPYLVCLVADSPLATLTQSQGINTNVFSMRFPLDITPLLPIVRFCRTNKIDIIHAHGTRANFIGRLAAKLISIPCLSTMHSLPEHDYTSGWKAKIALILDNLTLPLTSGVITVSNSLQESIFQRLGEKNEKIPVRTVYNGCPKLDYSNYTEMRNAFRNKWDISDKEIVIGTIGRLHPVKGHTYLISALQLLAQEIPGLHLLLVGDGPISNQLRSELDRADLSYTMTGYISSAWRCLPAMDIFVLPSLSEGMGLVLLEAAQAEVPMVASRVGGIPEVWENQTNALLINPADPEEIARACKRIIRDDKLREYLIANALQRARSLDTEIMAEETSYFYDQIATL